MRIVPSARVAAVVAALGLVVACTQSQAADLPTSGSVAPGAVAGSGDGAAAPGADGATGPASTTSTTAFVPTTTTPPPGLRATSGGCPASARQGLLPSAPRPTVPPATAPTTTRPSTPGAPPTAPAPTAPSTTTTTTPTPESLLSSLRTDERLAGATVSVSIWVDGWGEVVAENPDTALIPASNQKLYTAVGALTLLDPNERLHTDVVATGPIVDGVVRGDLVLVGGGDPWLTLNGFSSVDALAGQVQAAGITGVEGSILVDDSRYDDVRSIAGWPADWVHSVGPLSALSADHNMYAKDDPAVLADPAQRLGEVLGFALTARAVPVAGGVRHGSVPAAGGTRLARIDSPTISELVTELLLHSDNLIAELLTKEIGARAGGVPGTTAAGLAAIARVTDLLCGPQAGVSVDGSGLSYGNEHSARDLRRMLQAAALSPWGSTYVGHLPVAGAPGVLGGRLADAPTAGRVRAKGGTLAVSRSLSGYLTTVGGRSGVFSIIVNGPALNRNAEAAIDDLVTSVVSMPG
ncbi:MAG: D-alanyl-D-alanine carboxypeptidase [Acidimicrobiales bacterium]